MAKIKFFKIKIKFDIKFLENAWGFNRGVT